MSLYLDASLLVALFASDLHSPRAKVIVTAGHPLTVSDFAAAEFSSAIAGLHRAGRIDDAGARAAFANFDVWVSRVCERVQADASDVRAAEAFMRRLDLTLRTPDALHIATALRLDATLATFDARMALGARALGLKLFDGPP